MVADSIIDYTVADDNYARLNKTLFDNLDINLQLSSTQRSSWAIPSASDSLGFLIDSIIVNKRKTSEYAAITKRYYAKSKQKNIPMKFLLNDGRLSVYDDLFKKYSPKLDWDWRLLAAVSFEESRFDPIATSRVGARGLMQLMPKTGYFNGHTATA